MKLIISDKNNQQKAEVHVHSFFDHLVQGIMVSHSFDTILKEKIERFQDLVNNFVIGELLDEVTDQLDAYEWKVEGKNWSIYNFQVFDSNISFRIKSKNVFATPDFIAELQFLTTAQGGRKNPADSGYRPHVKFKDYPDDITSGQQTYLGQEMAKPGETVLAEISMVSKDTFTGRLYENMIFEFYEGKHTIGIGKILEIINKNLKLDH